MMYLDLDGHRFVFASKAGAEHHPDWYHNLVAHPQVKVEAAPPPTAPPRALFPNPTAAASTMSRLVATRGSMTTGRRPTASSP